MRSKGLIYTETFQCTSNPSYRMIQIVERDDYINDYINGDMAMSDGGSVIY